MKKMIVYLDEGMPHAFIENLSVAAARAGVFAILVNKFLKIITIFQQLDHLRSWWVLCQS